MKTDLIEIFQTIRASLQPYATLGFDNRSNTEEVYDLWSNKNVEIEGNAKHEVFFTEVSIDAGHVTLSLFPKDLNVGDVKVSDDLAELRTEDGNFNISELDEELLSQIEDAVAAAYKIYKDKGWVV
jgi:hypothetical protein